MRDVRYNEELLVRGFDKGNRYWTNLLCIRISCYRTGRFALRITRERHLRNSVDVFPVQQLKARISDIYQKSMCFDN
jgi:hypothetical protein